MLRTTPNVHDVVGFQANLPLGGTLHQDFEGQKLADKLRSTLLGISTVRFDSSQLPSYPLDKTLIK